MQKTIKKEKDKTGLNALRGLIGNIRPLATKRANLNPNSFVMFFKDYFTYFSRDLHGNSSKSSVDYIAKNIFQNEHVEDFLVFESKGYASLKQELSKIADIIDFKAQVSTGGVDFMVFLSEPNWEVEEKIYSIYSKILDAHPDEQVDLRIIDFCRKK